MKPTDDPSTIPETLEELGRSLTMERAIKAVGLIGLMIYYAIVRDDAHPFVPIILFALLADLMSLNRLRRLVGILNRDAGADL